MRNIIMGLKRVIPQRIKNYSYLFSRKKKPRTRIKFGIDIAKHCNLNCIGCDHFSCISEKSDISIAGIRKDLVRIKEIFGEDVEQINLLGGEPFLNDQIAEYCVMVRELFPNTIIKILTNGTLIFGVPQYTWDTLRQNDITILMTEYPVKFDYERAKRKILEHGLNLECMNDESEEKTMFCVPLDLEGRQNANISFRMCGKGNQCITLENGRLYTCTLIPNISQFNRWFGKNLNVCKKDYIDIYEEHTPEGILTALSKPVPFCRYCNFFEYRTGIQWEPSKKKIEEWI